MRTYSAGIVTAYGSAKAGGYTGTYAEFCEALGNLADVLEDLEGLTVVANTLPEGSTATASYSDGVLTLGIPKGDKGDKGDRGETGNGIASIVKTSTSGLVDTYTITYTDGSTETFTVTNGAKGDTGEKGDTGNGIESVELTSTSGAVKTYTITFTDGTTTTFDVTDGEVTNESLAETLEDYALTDGYYEEMTVGDAEQLVATQYVEDSEPYLFRTTGGSADVGNREYVDEIVGGTIAWNQLCSFTDGSSTNKGITFTKDSSNGTITANGTATDGDAYINIGVVYDNLNGHKILIKGCPLGGSTSTYYLRDGYTGDILRRDIGNGNIVTAKSNFVLQIMIWNGITVNNLVFKPQVIDLTQLFGSTIADYIYSLETATAGAGVAFFKKLFPNDYYPYNAGELLSVSGLSSHDTIGFNQWDTSTDNENRAILNDGTLGINSAYYVSDYIRVLPSATYYFKDVAPSANANSIAEYDAGKNFIRIQTVSGASGTNASGTKVMSDNTHYIRVARFKTSNDVCINLSWSGYRNGEYEEYQKHSYALDDSLTLRGVPKLDSSNNLYYDGDTYASDGTVTRKYGIVDLGSINWTTTAAGGAHERFVAFPPGIVKKSAILTSKTLTVTAYGNVYDHIVDNSIACHPTSPQIEAYASAYSDATAFKTAMSGVYLVYELATPTTESAEPYQQVQICDDFGTEEFVSTSIVPVGHNTRYPDNLRDKLQHLPHLADLDGYYMISQQNNSMSLELFRIPKAPTTDGTYSLKATVSGGTPTYTWEAES